MTNIDNSKTYVTMSNGVSRQINEVFLDFVMEAENFSEEDIIIIYSGLIKSGMAWNLEGYYGRNAHSLIENGICTKTGDINWDVYNDMVNENY